MPSGSTTHAFDINAETEPIEEVDPTLTDLPADLEDMAVESAFGEDNAGNYAQTSMFYFLYNYAQTLYQHLQKIFFFITMHKLAINIFKKKISL